VILRDKSYFNRREFLHYAGSTALALMIPEFLSAEKKAPSKTSFLYHNIYLKHDTGEFHYETPERLKAILAKIREAKLLPSLQNLAPRKVSLEWIETVHQREYIEIVRRDVESGAQYLSTQSGNTVICMDSFEVALWAVGGALTACDAVIEGKTRNVFCAIRPPGHHATPNRGMGYCLFNNVAIAARYLQKRYKIGKVLIIDWDVHHGNGTQEIFYEDGSVFFFSTHQWPWYPWSGSAEETGDGDGEGATLNVPLPAGSGDQELISAFENKLRPRMDVFKPDFILISAGFDSRNSDPLGRFRVTDNGFRKLTQVVLDIAKDHAQRRLVSVLEGGYSLKGLPLAVSAHLETLLQG
jgi:acetoin utilization deacetylase AcuC-like enzyme